MVSNGVSDSQFKAELEETLNVLREVQEELDSLSISDPDYNQRKRDLEKEVTRLSSTIRNMGG